MRCTFLKVILLQKPFSTILKRFTLKQIAFCGILYYLYSVQAFIAGTKVKPYYATIAIFSIIFVRSSNHSNYE